MRPWRKPGWLVRVWHRNRMKLEVKNLRKEFGSTVAIDDISFSFEAGQVFGFVGPNGAGKTTTFRILASLEEPTAGDAYIDGYSVREYPEIVRQKIGFVPDTLPTHNDMTVHEYLDFFARAYGLRGRKRDDAVRSIEDFTNVTGILEKHLKDLSKGMKQRVSLGRALVHDPAILIMDEPAAGLDPRARIELRELITALAENGKAILISSHILTELTEMCNGAVIIERGRLLASGTTESLVQRHDPVRSLLIRPLGRLEELQRALLEMPRVKEARVDGQVVRAEIEGEDADLAAMLTQLCAAGFSILEFKPIQSNLEDIFMKVTSGGVQ